MTKDETIKAAWETYRAIEKTADDDYQKAVAIAFKRREKKLKDALADFDKVKYGPS